MTKEEAECFRAMRRWQRRALFRQYWRALLPRPRWWRRFTTSPPVTQCVFSLLLIAASPLLLMLWVINALYQTLMLPGRYLSTWLTPRSLRAPGERNLKGLHYQFSTHISLPPSFYLQCCNEWIAILYGEDALHSHRLERYLDQTYIQQRQVAYDFDANEKAIFVAQISHARENVSRALGNY